MIWIVALMLLILAGLNAPLAVCALSLAAINGLTMVRPEFAWLGTLPVFLLALCLLVGQLLADLYFVPIRVRDRFYLHPQRTENAYFHARVQSFLRPLLAAVLLAAVPLPLADWMAAVLGFTGATGCYWLSAWVREHVAVSRGALVLLFLETLKNGLLIVLAWLTFWLPPLALGLLLWLLLSTILWTLRLQREQSWVAAYGGQSGGEDPRVVRTD